MNALRLLAVTVALAALVLPAAIARAAAPVPGCDALSPQQAALQQTLFSALHPYDACDGTFTQCLAQPSPAPVVVRLATDLCRQIRVGRRQDDIERALAKRAQTMLPVPKPAVAATDDAMAVGEASAPVKVVVYACVRCPFCKVLVPALHHEVSEGVLKGKVRLYFRPFPLKDHAGSTEGGLAFVVAAGQGRFWPMALRVYERFDAFCPNVLPEWAAELGLDRAAFEQRMAEPATRAALVQAKQEGIRNRVEATPALFIDGRRYVYEQTREAVVDVLLEAAEAAAARRP